MSNDQRINSQRNELTQDEVMEIQGSFTADTETAKTAIGVKGHALWGPATPKGGEDPRTTAITTKGLAEIQKHPTKEVRMALAKKGGQRAQSRKRSMTTKRTDT